MISIRIMPKNKAINIFIIAVLGWVWLLKLMFFFPGILLDRCVSAGTPRRFSVPVNIRLLTQCQYLISVFEWKLVAWSKCFLCFSNTPCSLGWLVPRESRSRNSLLAVKLRKEHQAARCHRPSQLERGEEKRGLEGVRGNVRKLKIEVCVFRHRRELGRCTYFIIYIQ